MAAVLAGGGFPVEALPALREGVDLALRSRAHKEGMDLPDAEKLPDAWIEAHLPFPLRPLRESSEILLGATVAEVTTWIAEAEALTHEIGGALRRLPSSSSMTLDVI